VLRMRGSFLENEQVLKLREYTIMFCQFRRMERAYARTANAGTRFFFFFFFPNANMNAYARLERESVRGNAKGGWSWQSHEARENATGIELQVGRGGLRDAIQTPPRNPKGRREALKRGRWHAHREHRHDKVRGGA